MEKKDRREPLPKTDNYALVIKGDNDTEYVVHDLQEIGRGGTCLVYRGKGVSVDEGKMEPVIIKEFYPKEMNIMRDGTNLEIREDIKTMFIVRMAHYKKGLNKHKEFYDKFKVEDAILNKPHYRGSANNTAYAVYEISDGKPLSEIGFDEFGQTPLAFIACIMQAICKAIGIIHSNGWLYLDCKPENFFYYATEEDADTKVYLFDFDTATSQKNLGDQEILSVSDDWASPEQATKELVKGTLYEYKDGVDSIGYHSDIYSIGMIFYWLLMGKALPTKDDLNAIQSNDGFDWKNKSTYCKRASKAVILKIQEITSLTLKTNSQERKELFPDDSSINAVRKKFEKLYKSIMDKYVDPYLCMEIDKKDIKMVEKIGFINKREEDEKKYITIRECVAKTYYESFKDIKGDNPDSRINKSLIRVFSFPQFEKKECLNISEHRRYYICAPNGYGKSILLKMLLIAANPLDVIKNNRKIKKVQHDFNIPEEMLALFVDCTKIKNLTALKTERDSCSGLLMATNLDIQLEDFRDTLEYYNKRGCLLLIFDSIDEISQSNEMEFNRSNVMLIIDNLTKRDGICNHAKVIIASRPISSPWEDEQYEEIHIKSLSDNKKMIKDIIKGYAPDYVKEVESYFSQDVFLKDMIRTPQLLTDMIYYYIDNKENKIVRNNNDIFHIIEGVINKTIIRFKSKNFIDYDAGRYDCIYEIFSYDSLFQPIGKGKAEFSKLTRRIINYNPNNPDVNTEKEIKEAIVEAYEHYSLFDSTGNFLRLISPRTFTAFYLAGFIKRYYKQKNKLTDEKTDEKKKWDIIDSICKNIYGNDDYLYDMLIFYFGHLYGDNFINYDPGSEEYQLWVDYIIYKWESAPEKIKGILNYIGKGEFIKDSRIEKIKDDNEELEGNEKRLKEILKEIEEKDD